ncbi:uncharacterized protein LOC141848053 [Curcuma longa]|uniref:uncharacterized protein LOC141848053 n=1 Tax=Curcuma longa TaxID=136217 RepID=UPI003D9E820F
MAENCSVLDLWARRSDSAWISEVSARENAAVTRALQMSLSDTTTTTSSSSSSSTDTISSPPIPYRVIPSSPTPSDASAGDASLRRSAALGPSAAGRVSKRKQAATTYIKVDLENFREMVQRATGVQGDWKPSESAVESEPVRPAAAALQQICLPTLDTSAILLGKSAVEIAAEGGGFVGHPPPTPAAEMPVFDLDSLLITAFPILDSWGIL